jgi:hypothetical protein
VVAKNCNTEPLELPKPPKINKTDKKLTNPLKFATQTAKNIDGLFLVVSY